LTDPQPTIPAKLLANTVSACRGLTAPWQWLVALLGGAMVLFYLYAAGVAAVATQYHRGVYVGITYVLIFLLYPSPPSGRGVPSRGAGTKTGTAAARKSRNPSLLDILLALLSALVVWYWIHEFENLNYRAGAETELDALVSIVGVLLSLEVCRRVLGWAMASIGLAMLAYAYCGAWLPGLIAHRGFGIERLATALFLTTNGIFGVMANVLATYVILFIFFGAFLHQSGAGRFFIDLPLALAGRSRGGPAKVAVIASALFGSVSGSAIANTVSTGAFTIPLMKRAGFRPHVAGAIEPAASIGGMFLPPIMGAGGFLMAELTETPYLWIMTIALFPALLYFLSVFCMIHFEACKHDIAGTTDPELPPWTTVLARGWYYPLPLAVITVLMILGRSPGYAAFWALLSCIGVSWFRADTRMGPRQIWQAIQTGARNTLIVGATLGVIGIIVGTISLTGIGLKFSTLLISLAAGRLLLAILLVGVASLVLGMGVPVTAAYLITAVLAVPPLLDLGVGLLAAHMIVYWFSQDSNITPPVCVAAYAGAAIAGADPWRTGWTAFKFAKLLYVMPLLFAFVPAILLQGQPLLAPPMNDQIAGGLITELRLAAGDPVQAGQVYAVVLDGEELRQLSAEHAGVVAALPFSGGEQIEGGAVMVELRALPMRVLLVMLSAVLGTVAFSALSMGYLRRRTRWFEWLLLAGATLLLYWPSWTSGVLGLLTVAVVGWLQRGGRGGGEGANSEVLLG